MDVRVYCLLVFILFCSSSAAQGARKQLPSALLVGRVKCDTCLHHEFSKSSHFISGASVSVECGHAAGKPVYRSVATTNRRGVFRLRLPPTISKRTNLAEACAVKLVESNEPLCAVASSAPAAGVRLKSKKNGIRVYSAGLFSFKPTNKPEYSCDRRLVLGAEEMVAQPALFLAPPSIPFVPSPPSVGPVPLPANPLFPPPSLLPPNPLQPPPSVLPPNPLQPPSPPPFNLPPIPFLAPPPPPPPPALPFPPVPVVPIPRIPGVPPAFTEEKASP
ncbi:steroidogenic factor 1 [Canna indica]|uniref:Steroidogenic factor 1 n=1 Tax=Canna indica TaxID=4628 RepID=A0AAQ3K9M1_9LILI|nr:steroidogenic factor 1 [Canna indica]